MNFPHKRIRLVCLLLMIALALTSIGVTYGRYQSNIRNSVFFQAKSSDSGRRLSIDSDIGWVANDQYATVAFSLKSGAEGQRALLRLTATEGVSPQDITVVLTANGTDYTGVAQPIDEGHPLFSKMGRGVEYRFYNADKECEWMVNDALTYRLTVEGVADASLLRLTATEI